MLNRNKKIRTALLSIFFTTTVCSFDYWTISAASNRIWGQDRYETSAAISKQGWTSSEYVVIASGEGYADALCAAPLAKKYNAPILLTESKTLNSNVKEEIKRLGAKHVLIIGKYASISQDTEDELKPLVSDIERLGGNDRYETSVVVAKKLGNISEVALTSGYGFADALSIAPIAAQKNMPILLTGKDELPQVVKNYVDENIASIKNSYIVGGQGVIGDDTAQQLSKGAVRLYGQNRFETNANVMKYFEGELKFDNLYVVQADGPTGNEFADALSGSALAARTCSPVILTYKETPSVIEDFIKTKITSKSSIMVLGGVGAVPDNIIATLEKVVNSMSTQQPPATQPSAGAAGGGVAQQVGKDGDVEFIFSKSPDYTFNYNNIDDNGLLDISSKLNGNNLVKIRVYSSSPRELSLALNGIEKPKNVISGWNEFDIPEAFDIPDTGAPGISQASLRLLSPGGTMNLTIGSKTLVVKYQ